MRNKGVQEGGKYSVLFSVCLNLGVILYKIYFPFRLLCSVADPDPGYGTFLTPGSGIRNRFFPDPGSRIPRPYF
jgi:hypothetical protein